MMDQLRELTNSITGEKLRHLGEDVEQLKQTMSLSNDMQQNGASGTNRLPSNDEAQSAEGAGINIDANKFSAVEIKVGTFEGIVTTLHREIERVLNVLDDRQKDMEIIKRDCEEKANKIEELERKLAYSEVQVTQLSQNVLSKDNCSFNGELVWRIENWSEVRAKAVAGTVTSLFSPPFYTSKYGYKMCVRYVSEMIESKDRIIRCHSFRYLLEYHLIAMFHRNVVYWSLSLFSLVLEFYSLPLFLSLPQVIPKW